MLMKLESDSTPAMTKVAVVSTTSRSLNRSPSVSPFHGLVGGDRENDLAPDLGMIALRQAHGAKEHADRDLAGEIVDELERSSFAYALERAVCSIEGGCNELLDVLARERGLAQ